jgi:AraC-like DNA-binding protein
LEESANVSGAQGSRGIVAPDEGRRHFTLTRRRAAEALAPWVDRHWTVRWDLRGRARFTQHVLPHPCVNLAFQNGRGGVFGMVAGRDSRTIGGAGHVFGTKFRPGAFASFSRRPMTEVLGTRAALGDVFGADGDRLERAIAGLDEREHYDAVERFLLERQPTQDRTLELISAVVADMLRCPPDATVATLAAAHGVSTRSLQRAFQQRVGVSPKWVLKRDRLHEAAERIAIGEADDLSALALDLGYFDVAHFTRQFTAAMGEPPGAYARRCAAATSMSTRSTAHLVG